MQLKLSLSSTSTDNNNNPNPKYKLTHKPKQKKHLNISATDKIKQQIKEWNTIEGIELIKPLNDLYSQLFILTYDNKLECLNYYIDEEKDESNSYTVMYAEIKDTHDLPLQERYNQHKDLLKRIINHDKTLIHCTKEVQSETLSLFNCIYN